MLRILRRYLSDKNNSACRRSASVYTRTECMIASIYPDVHIDTATDGYEMLRKMAAGKYDLVITDNRMPRMTGIEAVKKLRYDDTGTPVYIFSADGARKEAMEAGASGFIPKVSIDFKELTNALRRHLSD